MRKSKPIMKKILILISLVVGCAPKPEPVEPPHWSAVELLRNQHKEELSDFDKLTLAIAFTESRFNADADSGAGDHGILQLRSIYIDEVNRLYHTDYTVDDAFDIDKSLEMFRALQAYYNPSKELDRGIYLHNKSEAYKRTVMQNYELICRMEDVRAKLISK